MGCVKRNILKLPLGGLHVKHTEQPGIWVPTQRLLWDQGKPRKTLIELAGRRTFRMQTELQTQSYSKGYISTWGQDESKRFNEENGSKKSCRSKHGMELQYK
jgi:hypothetical protein